MQNCIWRPRIRREKTLLDDDDSCISIALMPVILKFTRTWTNKNEGKDEKWQTWPIIKKSFSKEHLSWGYTWHNDSRKKSPFFSVFLMHYDAFRYDGPKKMSNREVQIIERKLLHFSFFYASCNHLYKKSTNEKKNDLVDNVKKSVKLKME